MKSSRLFTFLVASLITVAQIAIVTQATTRAPPERASTAFADMGDSASVRSAWLLLSDSKHNNRQRADRRRQ